MYVDTTTVEFLGSVSDMTMMIWILSLSCTTYRIVFYFLINTVNYSVVEGVYCVRGNAPRKSDAQSNKQNGTIRC